MFVRNVRGARTLPENSEFLGRRIYGVTDIGSVVDAMLWNLGVTTINSAHK